MARPIRIEVTLRKEERKAMIQVKGETKEAALKDSDLSFMLKAGWKAARAELVADHKEVLEHIRGGKKNGVTHEDLMEEFRGVEASEMQRALGALRNMGIDATADAPYIHHTRVIGGIGLCYVASEYLRAHEADHDKPRTVADKPASMRESEPTKPAESPEPEMTKAEGKRQRKSIIDKAKSEDLMGDGLKQSFIDNMTEIERQYYRSLERFHIKLMIAEIKKKPQASSNAS